MSIRISRSVIVLIAIISLFSCKDSTVFSSKEEYDTFVKNPDNGFIQSYKTDFFTYEIKVNPPLIGDNVFTVNFRITGDKQTAIQKLVNLPDVQNYLSFGMLNDMEIRGEKGGVQKPNFYHVERNYGAKPSLDFYVDLPLDTINKENKILRYWDRVFGKGLVEFKINHNLLTPCYVK